MKTGSQHYISSIGNEARLLYKIVFMLLLLTMLDAQISNAPVVGQSSADFTLNVYPNYFEAPAGQAVTYPVFCNSINNFAGTVALSLNGVPLGVVKSYTFSINPVMLTANASVESDLTIITNSKAPAGYYSFMVNGSSSSLTHSFQINLSLLPSASSIPSAFQILLFVPMLLVALLYSKNRQASNRKFRTSQRKS